jgi:hypothetical protein
VRYCDFFLRTELFCLNRIGVEKSAYHHRAHLTHLDELAIFVEEIRRAVRQAGLGSRFNCLAVGSVI